MNINKSVSKLYQFNKPSEFIEIQNELNIICPLLVRKTLGQRLSKSPAKIKYGSVRGTSKASCTKSITKSRITLDKSKLGDSKILVLRNIILESCNLTYYEKSKVVRDTISETITNQTILTKNDLELLHIGRISIKDLNELNLRIQGLRSLNLSQDQLTRSIKKLAYETTEYYSMKYFDRICDHLQSTGIIIPKKGFKSLEQYLTIQENSGHSNLYY